MALKKLRPAANNGETQFEAQPEEKKDASSNRQSSANDGTLQVNTGELKLPQELAEEEETESEGFHRFDPAVLVILCLSLIFIATIAYVIWSGWEPPQR